MIVLDASVNTVIPSGARNLALSVFKTMRDSSSPAAPRNDSQDWFFSILLMIWKCRAMRSVWRLFVVGRGLPQVPSGNRRPQRTGVCASRTLGASASRS